MPIVASEDLKLISYMLRNNPLLVGGLLLIGAAGFLGAYMQLNLIRAGSRFPWERYLARRGHEVVFEYLKIAPEKHWSHWPA